MGNIEIARALISVSDKTGLVPFARRLAAMGVELISTGGTRAALIGAGLQARDISELTGMAEMMEGRVKTLHPKVHGGVLYKRDDIRHEADRAQHGIDPIDLIVVNLYPFEQTVARGADMHTCVENIDIGGPAMIRSAAKNHPHVGVIVDPDDYDAVGTELQNSGTLGLATRKRLAGKAFARTAAYDAAISNYFGSLALNADDGDAPASRTPFPTYLTYQFVKQQDLRYGENPHQRAAIYRMPDDGAGDAPPASLVGAEMLQGKPLSYNNIADGDAALDCVRQYSERPACVIVKHANPCGAAEADSVLEAYDRAYRTDPESAFGGIIALNRCLSAELASEILKRQFVEVIIAPEVSDEAAATCATKPNIRLLRCGELSAGIASRMDYKRVNGGLLLQETDVALYETLEIVSRRQPTEQEHRDLLFAFKIAKFVKSNAIVYARDNATLGIGAGQMSRVNSVRIAAIKAEQAGLDLAGCVVASDAFFPFADGLLGAAEAGATAVIQPGGAQRDAEIIRAADEAGLSMIFTHMRHFRH